MLGREPFGRPESTTTGGPGDSGGGRGSSSRRQKAPRRAAASNDDNILLGDVDVAGARRKVRGAQAQSQDTLPSWASVIIGSDVELLPGFR